MVIIYLFLVTGFQYFYSGNNSGGSQQINYTELVQEITDGNVKELTYQPNGSVIEVSSVYQNPKTSKEGTGIQFFTPSVTKVRNLPALFFLQILPYQIAKTCY